LTLEGTSGKFFDFEGYEYLALKEVTKRQMNTGMRLQVFVAWRTVDRTQGPPDRTCILSQAKPSGGPCGCSNRVLLVFLQGLPLPNRATKH